MTEEIDRQLQEETPAEKADAVVKGGRKFPDVTVFLLVLLTILVLSIAYFFVFALPGIQRDRLAWEKEKYNRERHVKESYEGCVEAAEREYRRYIELNATPVDKQAGAYSAPADVWEAADGRKQADLDQCSSRFGR